MEQYARESGYTVSRVEREAAARAAGYNDTVCKHKRVADVHTFPRALHALWVHPACAT